MWALFYKYTENRFSFAEYETEKEAKSEKKRLKKQTHFKFQVRKIKSDYVLEHPTVIAYAWQWIESGEFFFRTHRHVESGENLKVSLNQTSLFLTEYLAEEYAKTLGFAFPRERVRLAKIGIIN